MGAHALRVAIVGAWLAGVLAAPASAQETFEVPDLKPKPYTFGGYLEVRPSAVSLDRESLFYRLRQFEPGDAWLPALNGQLLVDAGYRRGAVSVFARGVLDGARGGGEWGGDASLYEARLSYTPSTAVSLDVGKRTLKWGKGYAWNPAAFLDRPKNPEDPALALEGVVVASADFIRSLTGPLQTIAFTPVVVPVYGGVNEDIGRSGHLHAAGKLYVLLFDTDLDVMFMSGGSRPARWGADFSRNVRPELEVHGEVAVQGDERLVFAGPDGGPVEAWRGGTTWLLGTRYLAPTNTTIIVEHYRRGAGFTGTEMEWYFEALEKGLGAFDATRDPLSLQALAALGRAGYTERQPMRSYLFARASQPDAFGQLYLMAAVTTIYNLDDRSFSLMQELQYRLLENLEVRSQLGASVGGRRTDFGERQGNVRVEVRARYSF